MKRETQISPKITSVGYVQKIWDFLTAWLGTFFEKKTFNFWKLILWPDRQQKSAIMLLMIWLLFKEASQKRKRSSAKKMCENFMPLLPTVVSFQEPVLTLSRIVAERYSRHKIKMYGDSGSPCLIPLEGEKGVEAWPMMMIVVPTEDTQDIIRSIRFLGKLKKERTLLMKPHSNLSSLFKIYFDCHVTLEALLFC